MSRSAEQIYCPRTSKKRFSGDLYVPRSDSFPLDQETKILILHIYNASNKDHFLNSPRKVINSKFKQQRTLNLIWSINHCAWDLVNCQTTCWPLSIKDFENFPVAQRKKYNTMVIIVILDNFWIHMKYVYTIGIKQNQLLPINLY